MVNLGDEAGENAFNEKRFLAAPALLPSFCMRAARLWLAPISPLYTAARGPEEVEDGASPY